MCVVLTCYDLLIMFLLQRGRTPLSSAADRKHYTVVEFLFSKGAKGDRSEIVSIYNTAEHSL